MEHVTGPACYISLNVEPALLQTVVVVTCNEPFPTYNTSEADDFETSRRKHGNSFKMKI